MTGIAANLSPSRQTPARTFADAIRAEYAAILDTVAADQLPIINKAIDDLAALTLAALESPAAAEKYADESKFVLSTLASETALAAVRADAALKQAVGRAAIRVLVRLGFAALSL